MYLFDGPIPTKQEVAITLRPYQQQAVDAIFNEWKTSQSTLLVLPTGTGKTVVFAECIRRNDNGRSIVLAHREELIDQAARKIKHVARCKVGVEMADRWSDEYITRPEVVVSSIQTQIAGNNGAGRMTRFDPHGFGLCVVDEAHHAPAASYRKVLAHYRQNELLRVLGVTATPDRADEKSLGQVFGTAAFAYELDTAIDDGWLVPVMQTTVHVESLNIANVRPVGNDLNQAQLAEILREERNVHGVVWPLIKMCGERKTLVFAAGCEQAELICDALNRHKPDCARFVYADTPTDERRKIFSDYARRKFQFLCNVGIATEGFDDPTIEIVAIARPTKSRALYAQMIGRGTRTLPGLVDGLGQPIERRSAIASSYKPRLEVIDFVGNAGRHKLVCAADVLGGKYGDEVIARATAAIAAKRDGADVKSELESAQRAIREEREKKRQEQLDAKRRMLLHRKDWALSVEFRTRRIDPFDAFDLEPDLVRGWNAGRVPTPKMRECLVRFGMRENEVEGLNYTQAHQLIGTMIDRRKRGLCTYRQGLWLARNGIDPAAVRFKDASTMIDEINRKRKVSA